MVEQYLNFFLLHGIYNLFLRSPDNAAIKKKILYSSSKNAFFGKLSGCKMIDAADMDDLQKDEVIKRVA